MTTTTTDTERPYRITDFHGDTVAEGLDDVPPLLNREQIDELSMHLEAQALSSVALVHTLRKLPDGEHGRGSLPDGFRPYCHDCGDRIEDLDDGIRAFGNYYHDDCTPDT